MSPSPCLAAHWFPPQASGARRAVRQTVAEGIGTRLYLKGGPSAAPSSLLPIGRSLRRVRPCPRQARLGPPASQKEGAADEPSPAIVPHSGNALPGLPCIILSSQNGRPKPRAARLPSRHLLCLRVHTPLPCRTRQLLSPPVPCLGHTPPRYVPSAERSLHIPRYKRLLVYLCRREPGKNRRAPNDAAPLWTVPSARRNS